MKPLRIALCQIAPVHSCEQNTAQAFSMIDEAAGGGADLVALPELFYLPYELSEIKKTGDMSHLLKKFSKAAQKNKVYIETGSLAIKSAAGLMNSSFLIGPSGAVLLSYSKCHLFDVQLKDIKVRESAVFSKGEHIATAKTPLCSIGILVCYDIRFPEMARRIALCGGELLLVPAVFNMVTGPAHWHLLHRARAVENQMFVAAISQARCIDSPFIAYGHSMVVSPWGDIIAEAGEREEIVFADLDPRVLEKTRKQLPVFDHRRADLYGK
jgi:omega-amidase